MTAPRPKAGVLRTCHDSCAMDEQQRSEPGLSALSLCARSERLARTQQGPRAARPPASAPQPLPRSPPKLGGERGVRGRTQPGRRAEGYGAQNGRRPLGGDRRRPRGNRIERRRAFEPQAAISRSCSSDRRGHLGDLSGGDPPVGVLVIDRVGVLDRLPGIGKDRRDRSLHRRVHPRRD